RRAGVRRASGAAARARIGGFGLSKGLTVEASMRALVTGGTGFLGSYLVRRWAERFGTESVVCLVPPQGNPAETATRAAFVKEGIACVEGDLRQCPVAKGLDGPWDVVIHLAAATDTSWPEERLAPINVQGTANLLDSLK